MKALITESLLTEIADAIREKTGDATTMTPAEMAEKINGILDPSALLEVWFCNQPGIEEIETDTTRWEYTFSGYSHLKKITINGLWNVGTSYGVTAFYSTPALEDVIFTAAGEFVLNHVMTQSRNTTYPRFYFVNATQINFSLSGGGIMFYGDSISRLEAPNCVSATGIRSGADTHLLEVDLKVSVIRYNGPQFQRNSALKTLVLRRDTTVTLEDTSYISSSCPIRTGGGHIYIPRALIEAYQTATNWAVIYAANPDVFRALEDWTEDGTTTGRMDWERIEAEV